MRITHFPCNHTKAVHIVTYPPHHRVLPTVNDTPSAEDQPIPLNPSTRGNQPALKRSIAYPPLPFHTACPQLSIDMF